MFYLKSAETFLNGFFVYPKSAQIYLFIIVITAPLLFFSCRASDDFISPVKENTGSPAIENFDPVPSDAQLAWQDAELVMFIHYGINTFTGSDVGSGADSASLFAPDTVDIKQWVSVAKQAGFKYLILTAKHHEGFCLWPSLYTEYSVKNSPWKNGQGDLVREFADECRAQGLIFGFYLSLWDKNHPGYGTPAYNEYYMNQMRELTTNYGEVGEIWLDGFLGWNNNLTYEDFSLRNYIALAKQNQPNSIMAIMGPDVRWVGNEDGLGSDTDWSWDWSNQTLHGFSGQKVWRPSECDVSIRPAWFYHEWQDALVKPADSLVNLYFESVGKNSQLLLNVPPAPDGKFAAPDVQSLLGFRQKLDMIFSTDLLWRKPSETLNTRDNAVYYSGSTALDADKNTFWAADNGVTYNELTVDLEGNTPLNIFRVEEAIKYGQRVESFEIRGLVNGQWVKLTEGTTIGRSRILKLPQPVICSKVKLIIRKSLAAPAIRTFSAFMAEL